MPGGSYIYFSDKIEFLSNEITGYKWKKTPQGDNKEIPIEKNDRAMDTMKYGMTGRPEISGLLPLNFKQQPEFLKWHEINEE